MTPALAPMGVSQDNWPATVGMLTGILAKETVVGTLNALYGSLAEDAGRQMARRKPSTCGAASRRRSPPSPRTWPIWRIAPSIRSG